MLVFSKTPERHKQLLTFSAVLEGQSGLITLTRIVNPQHADEPEQQQILKQYQQAIDDTDVRAFTLVMQASDFQSGLRHIMSAYGIGPITPNTALLNWTSSNDSKQEHSPDDYAANFLEMIKADINLVALASARAPLFANEAPTKGRRIDIWWRGGPTARLMLMFAYLCTRARGWQNTKLRILTEAERYSKQQVRDIFATYLDKVRIESEVEALDKVDLDSIKRYSSQSELVFFPIEVKEDEIVDSFEVGLQSLVDNLSNLVLVKASKSMQLDPDPDNGDDQKEG